MRTPILIAAALVIATPALAGSGFSRESCIFAAAERLPHVPGMTVGASSAEPYSGNTSMLLVRINAIAAGADGTYSFLCADVQGRPVVRRIVE